MKQVSDGLQFTYRLADQIPDIPNDRLCPAQATGDAIDEQTGCDQVLRGCVVDVPGDAPTLVVLSPE